jgi:hypothetical protein
MILATLSDGHALARVVVLKPLSAQMFRLLVERMGGLVNRRVFYLPFSRQVSISTTHVEAIEGLFKKCAAVGGVLLTQPEHILSFKLMTIDRLINATTPEETALAAQLKGIESWLEANSRDVLDESDEILRMFSFFYSLQTFLIQATRMMQMSNFSSCIRPAHKGLSTIALIAGQRLSNFWV